MIEKGDIVKYDDGVGVVSFVNPAGEISNKFIVLHKFEKMRSKWASRIKFMSEFKGERYLLVLGVS